MNATEQPLVVVTGGTGGLGQALVPELVAAGYRVAMTYRSATDFQALVARVGADYVTGINVDLLDGPAVQTAFAALDGPVYGLVNLAGGFTMGSVDDTTADTWQQMYDLNVATLVNSCRGVLPALRAAGRGRIIAVSSSVVLVAPPNLAAYTSTKSAIVSFTETLAHELKGTPITVNAILPGTLDTPANAEVPAAQRVPLPRVTGVIRFLLSPDAAGVTAAAIPITVATQ